MPLIISTNTAIFYLLALSILSLALSAPSRKRSFNQNQAGIQNIQEQYKVSLFQDPSLEIDQNVAFQKSFFYVLQNKEATKTTNKNFRDSEQVRIRKDDLTKNTDPIVQQHLKSYGLTYAPQEEQTWRMIRYHKLGHVALHTDRVQKMNGFIHYGIQVVIPPKNLNSFQGGALVTTLKGNQTIVLPDQEKWTHVIMPLGVYHKVKKVRSGLRISYSKQIWIRPGTNQQL